MTCLEGVSEFYATFGDKTGQRKMPGAVEGGSFSTVLGTLPQCQWRTEMASCESWRGMEPDARFPTQPICSCEGQRLVGEVSGGFLPQSRT